MGNYNPDLLVVGHCTDTTARIFAAVDRSGPMHSLSLAWKAMGNGATGFATTTNIRGDKQFRSAVIDLAGLPSGEKIDYAATFSQHPHDVPTLVQLQSATTDAHRQFRLLPPPDGRPLRIGLVSCNGYYTVDNFDRRFVLWRALYDRILLPEDNPKSIDLVIYAGDQIYADPIWMDHDTKANRAATNPATIAERYRDFYVRRGWNHPPIKNVYASCPSLMMWDDHDIYDGYGSNEGDNLPESLDFFTGAKMAFEEYQASHNPDRAHADAFDFGFVHGKVGIYVLDGRSNRDFRKKCVLGEPQRQRFAEWLTAHESLKLKHLFIVSAIPFIHAEIAGIQSVLDVLPIADSWDDDLRDQWASTWNQGEARSLLMRLFEFRKKSKDTMVTILSGDVHVGTIAQLESLVEGHRSESGAPGRIFQVVSSGIGHKAPGGLLGRILASKMERVYYGGTDLFGEVLPMLGSKPEKVLLRRNFATLQLSDDASAYDSHSNLLIEFVAEDNECRDWNKHSPELYPQKFYRPR